MTPPYYNKKYTLPCEAYQKEDGTWTSDAVDNFEKYVDQVVEKVDIKGFVYTQDFGDNTNSIHKNVLYVIGFILLVGLIVLIRIAVKAIKRIKGTEINIFKAMIKFVKTMSF